MSPDLALRAAHVASDVLPADRRWRQQYPVEVDLQYKLIHRRRVLNRGFGKTRDISTKRVFFRADQPLPKGQAVELSMDWPVPPGGRCHLELKIVGTVLRSGKSGTEVQIGNFEFRTRSIRPVSDERPHA